MFFIDFFKSTRVLNWTLVFAFMVLLVGIVVKKISDYDFWWHLNLGRQIFEQMAPVVTDKFSYTFADVSQFNGEWFADLMIYMGYLVGGFSGIAALKVILISSTFYFLAKAMYFELDRDKGALVVVILSLVVVLFALRFRLFVRPFLFSYLFVSIFLFLLQKYRHEANHKLLWVLPVLQIVWVNCSKGYFFGPLLIGLMAISELLEGKRDKRIWLVLLLTLGASCLSPEGWHSYTPLMTFMSNQSGVALVGEHQALSAQLLWGQAWHYFVGFQILLVGGLIYLVAMKGWRNIFLSLAFLAFAIPPFFMVRMIDFFALIAVLTFCLFLQKLFITIGIYRFTLSRFTTGGLALFFYTQYPTIQPMLLV